MKRSKNQSVFSGMLLTTSMLGLASLAFSGQERAEPLQKADSCPAGQFACRDFKGQKQPCRDLSADRNNCGSCGNMCQRNDKCIAGQCVSSAPACPPGQLACMDVKGQKQPCRDHSADRNNCGTCGVVCRNGTSCVAGACR